MEPEIPIKNLSFLSFNPILSIFVLASLGSMHCMCVCISLNTPVSLSTHIHSHSGCDLLTRIGERLSSRFNITDRGLSYGLAIWQQNVG